MNAEIGQSASRTRFGTIVVQGGVTTGLLNAVVAEDLPGPGSVFLHTDWSYRQPVRPGDTITATVTVLERRADKPITRLTRHRVGWAMTACNRRTIRPGETAAPRRSARYRRRN